MKLESLSIYISINLGTIFDLRLYIMNEYHVIYFPNVCSDSKQALISDLCDTFKHRRFNATLKQH